MDKLTDEQLVGLYLKGQKQALETLIQRYFKFIYNFIYRIINNKTEAEDLVQETFLKVWQNLKKFDQKRSFKTWIFKIAKNCAIDYLRRKKIIVFSQFDNEEGENTLINNLADPGSFPDELFEVKNIAEKVEKAVNELDIRQKTVLILHYMEQLTFAEIAEVMEESIDTIKSRHRRALIKLKNNLELKKIA